VTTEGVVGCYTIRRTISKAEGGNVKLDCVVDDPISVDTGDGRQVTAVQWLEVSCSGLTHQADNVGDLGLDKTWIGALLQRSSGRDQDPSPWDCG
jgi:hypothetical protein